MTTDDVTAVAMETTMTSHRWLPWS